MMPSKNFLLLCSLVSSICVGLTACSGPCNSGIGNAECDDPNYYVDYGYYNNHTYPPDYGYYPDEGWWDDGYYPPPCPGASFNPYALSPCPDYGYPDYGWDDGYPDAGEDLGIDYGEPDMPGDMPDFEFVEPSFDWVRTSGGAGDAEQIHVVVSDPQGNVYVAGSFEQRIEFEGNALVSRGGADIFVALYDSAGSLRWVTQFGAEGDDLVHDGACDSQGNLILSGQFEQTVSFGADILTSQGKSDAVLFEVSSASQVVWAKGFGGKDSESGERVAIDSADQIVLGLSSDGSFSLDSGLWPEPVTLDGAGELDAFLIRLLAGGEPAWVRSLAGPQNDRITALTVTDRDEILFGGDFEGLSSLASGELSFTLESQGARDAWMSQWTSQGDYVWHRSWGGPGQDAVADVASASGKGIILGSFEQSALFHDVRTLDSAGEQDLYLMMLEQDGRLAWLRHMQSTGSLEATALDTTARHIIFGTSVRAPIELQSVDTWHARSPDVDATAQPVWAKYDLGGELVHTVKLDGMRDAGFEALSISGDQLFLDLVYRSDNQRNAIMGEELPRYGQRDFALVKYTLP